MGYFWFWLLILLIIFAIFAWPSWPHTRECWPYRYGGGWRYAPTAGAIVVALFIIWFVWLGILIFAWPGVAY
jgi:hypothetical protein